MRKQLFFILFVFLTYSPASFSALDAYLTLTGETQGSIHGDVTQAGREDTIRVVSYGHLVFTPRDSKTGLLTGKRQHEPLRITKEIDRSTPKLMRAWVNGEKLTECTLEFWRPTNTGAEQQYYTVVLTDAYIVSVRQEMLNNLNRDYLNYPVLEHVTLVYSNIEWIYDATGESFNTNWDYAGASILISDLNGDGIVNLLDLGIFANDWLETTQ
jgi:type VI secretion system secreted protein Hcp